MVAADADWEVTDEVGRRCRFVAGQRRTACGRPAVARLMRGRRRRTWWYYCGEHLYGRWVEAGRVVHSVLRPRDVRYFDVRAQRSSPWGTVEQVQVGRYDGAAMGWREVWEVLDRHRPGCWALEVLPPREHLVDEVNAYHLWVLPPGVRPGPLNIREEA
jgi:hypothetical protein